MPPSSCSLSDSVDSDLSTPTRCRLLLEQVVVTCNLTCRLNTFTNSLLTIDLRIADVVAIAIIHSSQRSIDLALST